jgi:hypothetical protein
MKYICDRRIVTKPTKPTKPTNPTKPTKHVCIVHKLRHVSSVKPKLIDENMALAISKGIDVFNKGNYSCLAAMMMHIIITPKPELLDFRLLNALQTMQEACFVATCVSSLAIFTLY